MKKILNIILALAALSVTACDLTRLSEDDVAPENYFTSADECKLLAGASATMIFLWHPTA